MAMRNLPVSSRVSFMSDFSDIAATQLPLHGKQERLLKRLRHPSQKTRSVRAINQAMIVGERERQDQPRLELPSNPLRFHPRTRKSKNGNLGMIHDWCKSSATDAAQVGDG